MNVTDKVINWLSDNLKIEKEKLFDDNNKVRWNTDGTILVNLGFLKSQGLDTKYFDFLKSMKNKP